MEGVPDFDGPATCRTSVPGGNPNATSFCLLYATKSGLIRSRSFLYRRRAACASSNKNNETKAAATREKKRKRKQTMKLKICPPGFFGLLLFPFVILFDRPFPILRPLYILAPFFRVCFETEDLCEFPLFFQACSLTSC